MFSQNSDEVKLEWMYKGTNSTIDREEYLLGRPVDKAIEQLNSEEKLKQSGSVQPLKNHVEHECIPPSIRDYQEQIGEQVDLAAKLQEDPFIAIRKREEEKRRQFLNNPVQIKKLQKALKLQQKLKQNDMDDGDLGLNKKLYQKFKTLNETTKNESIKKKNKKSKKLKTKVLDTILIHKYNQLKLKLTEDDLRDIYNGKLTDSSLSDTEESEESDDGSEKRKTKRFRKKKVSNNRDSSSDDETFNKKTSMYPKRDYLVKKYPSYDDKNKQKFKISKDKEYSNKRCPTKYSNKSSSEERKNKKSDRYEISKSKRRSDSHNEEKRYKNKKEIRSSSHHRKGENVGKEESANNEIRQEHHSKTRKSRSTSKDRIVDRNDKRKSKNDDKYSCNKIKDVKKKTDISEKKINKYKKFKRNSSDSSEDESCSKNSNRKDRKKSSCSSSSSDSDSSSSGNENQKSKRQNLYSDSDNSDTNKKMNFGLVTAEGDKIKIPENKKRETTTSNYKQLSVNTYVPPKKQKLTDKEKEKRRQEMIENAAWRDLERAKSVKKHRQNELKESEQQKTYDTEFIQKELLKSANSSSVESRIKSSINKIQRSSSDMNKNFSRR